MIEFQVCFIDSGVGGIGVMNECRKLLPRHNFFYVADNLNAPYGNLSKGKLKKILINLVQKIYDERSIKIFVLACNTATAVAINDLRKHFNKFVFIGIEPAIKPAVETKQATLVLCTKATAKYSSVLKKYKNKRIFISPQKDLAKKIDENLENLYKIQDFLQKNLEKHKKNKIKNIVLGCTHYNFIKSQLTILFPNAIFFDSNLGVAKRLQNILKINNIIEDKGYTKIETTKKDENFSLHLLKVNLGI